MEQRIARLLVRLDIGILGTAVDLARHAGQELDWADYRRLCDGRLTERDSLMAADDATLLRALGNDARKVAIARNALEKWRPARSAGPPPAALPAYR